MLLSSVGLSQFGYVLFSWFDLVCFVLFTFCWPSICFTSIFCWLPHPSILHLFWLVVSCSWCAMVGMVVVALDLFLFGFGSVKWCLSWFCIQSWLTWSHFLLLNGHSQQPQTECTIRFRLKGETYLFTHLFTSVLMPHWYTTAVRPINVTPPINVIVPHKCHSASHKCHSSP